MNARSSRMSVSRAHTKCGLAFAAVLAVVVSSAALEGYAQGTGEYIHPFGFSLEYPSGWHLQVDEGTGEPVMVPDDAMLDPNGGPMEVFGFNIIGAPAASNPAAMARVYDELYEAMLPMLRRSGPPEPISHPLGSGVVLTYEGVMAGYEFRQQLLGVLHDGLILQVSYFGEAGAAESRRGAARDILASIEVTQRRSDRNLVGSWHRSGSDVSSSYGGDYVASTTDTGWAFMQDGSCMHTSQSSVSGSVGGFALNSAGDGSDGTTCAWAAEGNMLYVAWLGGDGGVETYQYVVFEHEGAPALKLSSVDEEPAYFRRID